MDTKARILYYAIAIPIVGAALVAGGWAVGQFPMSGITSLITLLFPPFAIAAIAVAIFFPFFIGRKM
ncbi:MULTISPECIES: hypothetical protein [Eggerthellaceae]|jgi:ABC-type sulfate transport system permease subunit|uniref:hypothetical protein n=1 Tax=Eggerthellaceae TaxID=1643826 RepID=UPI001D06B40C|nr:hypothetical protein [Gordonibacter urolithinfaciens]MCB7087243.1 hypothetical protein [Gordonibacter urolithinfaciens]